MLFTPTKPAPAAATMAEVLRERGYATLCAGKWHLAPMEECTAAGPHTNWPLQKGFDRFYGFLNGETDQFYPELTRDNQHCLPPRRPEHADRGDRVGDVRHRGVGTRALLGHVGVDGR